MSVDFIRVLETAYAREPEDRVWAERVLDAAKVFLPDGAVGLYIVDDTLASITAAVSDHGSRKHRIERSLVAVGGDLWNAYRQAASFVVLHSAVERALPAESREKVSNVRRRLGFGDAIVVIAHPLPGIVVVLFAAMRGPITISRRRRSLLAQLASHLETSYRLRRRQNRPWAVLDERGGIIDRSAALPESLIGALATYTQRIERARSPSIRRTEAAPDLWAPLVAGEVSVVERPGSLRREYLVVENAGEREANGALTPGEADVLSLLARGLSGKLVAYSLGISTTTVTSRIAAVASKLEMMTPTELVQVAAVLTPDLQISPAR